MQSPPSTGYDLAPNEAMQHQGGPQKPFPQGYPQYQAGDNLSADMANMQIGTQNYHAPVGGFAPQPNGQQYSNGQPVHSSVNQQQFRPPTANTPVNHGSSNGVSGSPSTGGPPQMGLPPQGHHVRNQQGHSQEPSQAGTASSSAPQMGALPSGASHLGALSTGPSQFRESPAGPPAMARSQSSSSQNIGGPTGPPSGPSQLGGPSAPSNFSGPRTGPSTRLPHGGGISTGNPQYSVSSSGSPQQPMNSPTQMSGPQQMSGPPGASAQMTRPSAEHPQVNGPPGAHSQMSGPPGGHPQMSGPPGGHPQMSGPPGGHSQMSGPPGGHSQMSGPLGGHSQMSGPPGGHSQISGPPGGHSQMSGPPGGHSQMSGPPGGHSQMSGPPGGHSQMSGPPGGHSQMSGPPGGHSQMSGPPGGHSQMSGSSGRHSQMSGPPGGHSRMSGPPGAHPQMSGPPGTHPQMSGPPGAHPQMSGPPGGPPNMSGPTGGPSHLSGPPGRPSQLSGPSGGPSQINGPPGGPSQMSGPPGGTSQMSGPPGGLSQMSGPPGGPPQTSGHPGAPPQMSGHPGAPPQMSGHPGAPPQMSGHPGGPQQQSKGPSQMSQPSIGASPSIGGQVPLPPQNQAQGPGPYGSTENAGFPQRPMGFPGQPPTGVQNGLQSGPTSAFQPPPHTQGLPPVHAQGYAVGSPMSPPGQYNPPPNGQGFAPSPPNMYNHQNGQYPPQQQPQPQQQQLKAPGPHGFPAQPQAPPQRKLDPDHMPSPIQVIEDDRKNFNQVFGTSRMGNLPPLVTTEVEIQDEGNSGPNYIRSTVYSVPCSPDVIKQTQVPLAVAIMPFARHARTDGALPLSAFNEEIVRCNRCKAYMCPFMQFMDGGRRFQCVFCKASTEVPQNYFNHLDHNGMRVDKWQRAELCLGSYEILATQEYCKNNAFPKAPPAFIFIVDVSYNAVKNGMVQLFCKNISEILEDLPTEEGDQSAQSGVRVGFITYSSQVHFYNLDPALSNPQMMVVPDVVDMFVPFLEGCLVKASDATHVIASLCEEIPKMFSDTRETETILGPAIKAGMEALKAAECPGKLFVFHTTMPTLEAPGKLRNRDDRKLLGTDKEKTVLAPACPYYQELAAQCVQTGCSVDLFVANNSFVDIPTIGQIAKITGGDIYKYTYFQADTDGERFLSDLRRDVARPIAFDAVLRVRTSTGLRPTDFYGNFYMANTTDVELASIDCDKCITVEMKYDDKLPEGECAFIQVALLYTSVKGVRRLRLHNLCLQTTSQMADMFRNCELDTIMNLFCKQGLRQLMDGNPKSLRESITLRASTILANYRKHCATASSSGQLILPECMKLMPLYICCMLKSDALAGGPELTVDDRAYAMTCLGSMDVKSSQVYLYPRLLAVHNLDPADNLIPVATRTTVEKLRENEAYILENGILMFFYVGLQIDPSWCEAVFGVNSPVHIDVERGLPVLNTPQSKRLNELICHIRNDRQRFMKLYVVRQGDKWERVLRQFLVEDRMSEIQPSYVDYLCQLHREIRSLI